MEDFILNSPIMYSQQMFMDYFNLQPSSVKGRANISVDDNKRLLYTKLASCFEFTLPKEWAINYFRFWLFRFGSIGVVYTKEYGWVAQPYSIEEIDFQFQPKKILVYNSFFRTEKHGIIGVNSGIIHCMDDYFGLDDVVTKYSEMLAQVERSINVNLMNSNIAMYASAQSKKEADEIKLSYEKATSGEPLVVVNKDVLTREGFTPIFSKARESFIVPELLEARRAIMSAFLTEIGIRNVAVQKKERLTAGEYSENNDETKAIVSVIYDNIKYDMEYINALSGLNLDVRLRYDYMESEVNRNDNTMGNVSIYT